MYTDIKTYIKTCEICQRSKRDTHSHPVPLKPMPIEEVFSRWHMDILELPETPEKYRYLLLVVDSGSKWCEAFPMRTLCWLLQGTPKQKIWDHQVFLQALTLHITHFKIENNVQKCFIHYEQRHIYDPEWVPFETCPPGLLKIFQDKYEDAWLRCYN
ncbi:unnamed protein product [Mytilus coruscus]|uniref:Integrase zinc-binding domain-containing protein n=1 Tax=Mytilus coruscus TaxID=42192 RepID=A0A6J8F325_MYTCO|nr:unnamed protein product [Mytilus coruscus]